MRGAAGARARALGRGWAEAGSGRGGAVGSGVGAGTREVRVIHRVHPEHVLGGVGECRDRDPAHS